VFESVKLSLGREKSLMPKSKPRLILGSASPRRRELLQPFFRLQVRGADIDETPKRGETPSLYTRRVAREKFEAIRGKLNGEDHILLTADTTVALGKQILGKPRSAADAKSMLQRLSAKPHEVISAVVVGDNHRKRKECLVRTKIVFRVLAREEIASYIRSSEWRGKAGAYGIQGKAQSFVKDIRGSLTNVIGLPLYESLTLLEYFLSSAGSAKNNRK